MNATHVPGNTPKVDDYPVPCEEMHPDWNVHIYCRDSRACEYMPKTETLAEALPRVLEALRNPCRKCGRSLRGDDPSCVDCEALA